MMNNIEFNARKNDSQYIYNLLKETEADSQELFEIINSCDTNVLTNDIIGLGVQKGFFIRRDTQEYIKNNANIVKIILQNTTNKVKITSTINNSNEKSLTEENIMLAITKGYRLSRLSPNIIKQNSKYVHEMLKLSKSGFDTKSIVDNCKEESLTKENIDLFLTKGYYVDEYTPYVIALIIIKEETNLMEIRKIVESVSTVCLTHEFITIALQKKYRISKTTPDPIKDNPDIIKIILDSIADQEEITRLIDTVGPNALTTEVVNLAIDKGYQLTKKTKDIITQNPNYIKRLLEKNSTSLEVRNTILFSGNSALTEENISLALSKGFYYKEKDNIVPGIPYNLDYQSNPDALKELLSRVKDKESIIDIIINCNSTALTEEILQDLNSKYNIVNYKTAEKLNEISKKVPNSSIKESSIAMHLLSNDDIFSQDIVNLLPGQALLKIYKYLYLTEQHKSIQTLIKNKLFKDFVAFYTEVLNESLINFNVLYFNEMAKKYLKYQSIIKEIKTEEDKQAIKKLFETNYDNLEINSLEEAKNLSHHIFIENKNILYTVYNIETIKDIIYLLLCNKPYKEIKRILEGIINSNKIDNLYHSIKDQKIKELLKEYKITISFLEYIMNCNDVERLKELGNILNEMYLNDNTKFNSLFSILKDLEPNIISIYSMEANQELTQIQGLMPSEEVTIEKDKYGENIHYIDIQGEYYFLIHTMNAFGNFSKITDWKNPRLVGKPYISISSISQDKIGVQRTSTDINSVTVIFDKIYPTSLITMAEKDVFSYSKSYNDLNIGSGYTNFNTLKENLRITPSYNEYVLYRENDDGSYIYPSAILVTGDEPNSYEIEAAKYLNIPLVKTHPNLGKKNNYIQSKKEIMDLTNLKDKLEELLKLQKPKSTSQKSRK